MSALVLRTTTRADLPAVARCHAHAFPRALTSLHGATVTERMLQWYVDDPRGVLFHLDDGGRVAGYCGAIRNLQPGQPGAFTSISQFAFRTFALGYLRRPWLLLHPENLAKRAGILRNVMLRLGLRRHVAAAPQPSFRPHWGLVVIGVDPDYRGQGCGGRLMHEFERRALEEVQLGRLSVRPSNRAAIELYERTGWSVVSRTDAALVMEKELSMPEVPAR